MSRVNVVLAMRPDLPDRLFDEPSRARLHAIANVDFERCLTEFDSPPATAALARAELLLTGWEAPRLDAAALVRAPRLEAVVHAAGSVKGHLDRACWQRGLAISTAADANAAPVAEFTVAMIVLTGKAAFAASRRYQQRRSPVDLLTEHPRIGNRGRRVGIVGGSRIGRRVLRLLRSYEVRVAVADPYLDQETAAELGATLMDLDAMLGWADVVSLHAPALPQTRHLIDAGRLASMPDGATLINTARGALVDHDALIAELTSGRLDAVLDVTEPEPLPPRSPLHTLPNVMLTPHLAGALGNELGRLGEWAVDEVERHAARQPFAAPVRLEDLDRMA